MNIKQKMIEAMQKAHDNMEDLDFWGASYGGPEAIRKEEKRLFSVQLEAALSVAADPANWPNYKNDITIRDFAAVINHIKGLPS